MSGWKNWVEKQLAIISGKRECASWVAGILFAYIFVVILLGIHNDVKNGYWLWARLLYGVWTIGVPMWFFLEYVYCSGKRPAKPVKSAETAAETVDYETKLADYEAKLESLRKDIKGLQEAARPVWAGCVAALGLLLVMVGNKYGPHLIARQSRCAALARCSRPRHRRGVSPAIVAGRARRRTAGRGLYPC
jgi:hypothetical protein